MAHLSVRKDSASLPNEVGVQKPVSKIKKFGSKIMPTLSKLSKAFLLPIALLPIAGVFLGVGAAIANAAQAGDTIVAGVVTAHNALWYFGTVLNKMGDVCFGNLPVLFCISVAMAYSKDSGVAALTAVVGFLVMNGMQAALIHPTGHLDGAGKEIYGLLFHTNVPNGLVTNNIGVQSLNTGVFAGIFIGAISAKVYNRFHKTQLHAAISFFSGTKLVPIITFFMVIPLSFIFMIFWPWIGLGLAWFGQQSGQLPGGLDSFIYEVIERSLVPFGLHHVFYAPLWWTNAGGSFSQTMLDAQIFWAANPGQTFNGITAVDWVAQYNALHGKAYENFDAIIAVLNTKSNAALWESMGDQTMMAKVLANLNLINFTDLDSLGLNLGRFQSGKFGFMMMGLPAAAFAMWLTVPKENRNKVLGIYASAAFTCFLTGITEPLEYTFLFLAPWMFYGIHMPLASLAFLFTGMLHTHVSMTVSGGIIDYIVFGIIPFASGAMKAMNVFGVLIVAAVSAPCYFFAFYFAVRWFNVKVPGRGDDTNAQLFTKDDFRAKHGQNRDGSLIGSEQSGSELNPYTTSTNPNEIAKYVKAAKIIEFVGGQTNIVDIDACASRLRLTVVDGTKINRDGIVALGGATGALVKGTNVQIAYGGEQEAIKPRMIEILKIQRNKKVLVGAAQPGPIVTETHNKIVLVADDMIVECPKCGEKFQIELLNNHVEPTKKVPAKKTTKPVAKKAVVKKESIKTEDVTASNVFLADLETKYAKELAAQETAEDKAKKAKMTAVERAKVDGSDSIQEARSELQKHANQLRTEAKKRNVKFKTVNLRDMTKKELIIYMQEIATEINKK